MKGFEIETRDKLRIEVRTENYGEHKENLKNCLSSFETKRFKVPARHDAAVKYFIQYY